MPERCTRLQGLRTLTCLLALVVLVSGVRAAPSEHTGPGQAGAFLQARRMGDALMPRARLGALELLAAQPVVAAPNAPARSRYVLPMLLSAALPGAGEISMGHWWRGLPLVAADVATWLGYVHFDREGNDIREAYERYADENWSENRWQDSLTVTRFYDENAPWNCDCSPPYIPPDEDLREYYENLGKYPQFFPGWADWQRGYDPEDPQSLRRIYSDMRIDSNSKFDNAHRLLGVAAITRVASVIQSFWLVRRESRSDGLMLEPFTFGGFGSGLRVTARF